MDMMNKEVKNISRKMKMLQRNKREFWNRKVQDLIRKCQRVGLIEYFKPKKKRDQ